jgi:hypothetical protein
MEVSTATLERAQHSLTRQLWPSDKRDGDGKILNSTRTTELIIKDIRCSSFPEKKNIISIHSFIHPAFSYNIFFDSDLVFSTFLSHQHSL